jgi:CubicO group peptidase (beta-lactamase class C family)
MPLAEIHTPQGERMLRRAVTATLLLVSLAHAQRPDTKTAIASLTRDLPTLMQQADIPGLSIALVENGRTAWLRSFGTIDPATNAPVTDHTRFSAASLSKPVFAYAVLQLVDQGKLDLDTPLTHYWPSESPYSIDPANDPRLQQITARIVLSHRTGFPNWRPDGKPLTIYFTPGSRFSYSGEGYVYLQHTIERIEGKPLNQIMQEVVFTPLSMNDSTYISLPGPTVTSGYSPALKPRGPIESKDGNAAASLLTNAHDYALFVEAILSGRGLKPATLRQMETPQIAVDPNCTNCADHPAPTTLSKEIFWGLGWGIEQTSTGKYLWHWGDNPSYKAFVSVDLNRRSAVVAFTNSQNGLAIARNIVADAIGGEHPVLHWHHYDPYDSPSFRFTHDVVHDGAKALTTHAADLQQHVISEDTLESAGYILLYDQKKNDDAIAVFTRNVELHPDNGNAHASLGEGYMVAGNNALAIKSYERALELVPNSNHVRTQLAKLHASDTKSQAAH